jgi:hypothetical protein
MIALKVPRRRAERPSVCRRCAGPMAFLVAHRERGTFGYCLSDFRRLGDVPPGSVVTVLKPPDRSRPGA